MVVAHRDALPRADASRGTAATAGRASNRLPSNRRRNLEPRRSRPPSHCVKPEPRRPRQRSRLKARSRSPQPAEPMPPRPADGRGTTRGAAPPARAPHAWPQVRAPPPDTPPPPGAAPPPAPLPHPPKPAPDEPARARRAYRSSLRTERGRKGTRPPDPQHRGRGQPAASPRANPELPARTPGQAFCAETLNQDVRELWNSGLFDDSRSTSNARMRAVVPPVLVRERPNVAAVEFEGNQEIETKT